MSYSSKFLHGASFHLPYSGKFSQGPIFADEQSSKISQSNFVDGRSRAVPPTLPVSSASHCMHPKTCEMEHELHTMKAIVHCYHVYKEIWCAAEVIDHLLRDQLINQAITLAMPLANCAYLGHENLRAGIYFTTLISRFANQPQKLRKLDTENFLLYSILHKAPLLSGNRCRLVF